MTTLNDNNLKVLASAVAALVLTMFMSWTFVDATKMVNVPRDGSFVGAFSALVR